MISVYWRNQELIPGHVNTIYTIKSCDICNKGNGQIVNRKKKKNKTILESKEQLVLKIDFYTIRRVIENLRTVYNKNLTWERTGYLQ